MNKTYLPIYTEEDQDINLPFTNEICRVIDFLSRTGNWDYADIIRDEVRYWQNQAVAQAKRNDDERQQQMESLRETLSGQLSANASRSRHPSSSR